MVAGWSERLDLRARLALHFGRRLAPPVAAVLLYTTLATVVVRWDMDRAGEKVPALSESLYGMYMQVFFQPVAPLPHSTVARLVFFVTPIVGGLLIAQGVAKVAGELLDAGERRKLWVSIMTSRMRDHVVVCGLGHVGYRVVEALDKLGVPIVALERKEDSFLEFVRAMNVPVIVGDARRDELLVEAGIAHARAVVCATNDDLANLEVALDAKRMNPKIRVVLRMFDQRLANKVGGALDLDQTFSTSALAAPLVAFQATHEGVRSVYELEGGALRVVAEVQLGKEASVPHDTIGNLEEALDARVLSVRAPGANTFKRPRTKDAVPPGATLLVDADADALLSIKTRLGQ